MIENLTANEAGVLYKILPHFHYSTYFLAKNPNTKDISNVDFLNLQELAEIDMDDKALSKMMTKLQRKGIILKISPME